jgi:hypothetical protein
MSPTPRIAQLSSHPEIGQLDLTLIGEQDVGRLDISMNLPLRVQVFQPEQHLSKSDSRVRLGHWARSDLYPASE